MIGLKAKSENEIELSHDINLYTLKLMPEAVFKSSLCRCMSCLFPLSLHVLRDAHLY